MTTNQNPATATASILVPGETYVRTSGLAIRSYSAFAEEFRAAGGESISVVPTTMHPALRDDDVVVMTVTGTPDALDYVESLLAS